MEQMSCARRGSVRWDGCGVACGTNHSAGQCVICRAEPDKIQMNQPTKQNWTEGSHQLPAARTTPTAVLFVSLSLCNKTMTAQSLPSKSCVGGTKRPMATGEWNETLNWKPWLLVNGDQSSPSPSSAHINKILVPQLDHFHAPPTNQNFTSNLIRVQKEEEKISLSLFFSWAHGYTQSLRL